MTSIPTDEPASSPDETAFVQWLSHQADQHFLGTLKALCIGLMVFFSVSIFTGSAWNGLQAGTICLLISLFNTWRRYLEKVALIMLCTALFVLCAPNVTRELNSAVISILRNAAHDPATPIPSAP